MKNLNHWTLVADPPAHLVLNRWAWIPMFHASDCPAFSRTLQPLAPEHYEEWPAAGLRNLFLGEQVLRSRNTARFDFCTRCLIRPLERPRVLTTEEVLMR